MKVDPTSVPPLFAEASGCLAKQYLTPSVYHALKSVSTASGFTLTDAIASGVAHPDSSIGIYAGDQPSYDSFALLLEPIIQAYHGFSGDAVHQTDLTPVRLPELDPENKFIRSTRIRVARNLKAFTFPCHMRLEERSRLAGTVLPVFEGFSDEFKGHYVSLENGDEKVLERLAEEKILFARGDRFQDAGGFNRDFPKFRGVFFSENRHLRIWINEEDHLRIISQSASSDLAGVFSRLCDVLARLETRIEFCRHPRYGYLNSCPTNIGTGMRASVHICLPALEKQPDLLHRIVTSHNLQVRGTGGEKTRVTDAVFDISNRQRLGITEKSIIETLAAGIRAIIDMEKQIA